MIDVSYSSKRYPIDWLDDIVVPDLTWVVNPAAQYGAVMRDLPNLLGWSASDGSLLALQVLGRSTAVRRLRSSVNYLRHYNCGRAETFLRAFSALPAASKVHITMRPDIYKALGNTWLSPELSLNALERAIEAEQGVASGLSSGQDEIVRTTDSVLIEFDGPAAESLLDGPFRQHRSLYRATERSPLQQKINNACRDIQSVSYPASAIVSAFTRSMVLVRTTGVTGSGSQAAELGRIAITGADRVSLAELASSIIHESIHNLLATLEIAGPFVVSHADVRSIRLISGWTGRPLTLPSFIHACFVWYGLTMFWLSDRAGSVFGAQAAAAEVALSSSGFLQQSPSTAIAPHKGMLRYDLFQALQSIENRMSKALNASLPHVG